MKLNQYAEFAPDVPDKYKDNRSTGSLIIIDENTNNTVGAGMII